ncbi:YdcF family protein [Brevibacillus sp. M2.1A]|uniref:YdcF family protein n=1 Tax=Brevibacillus TaxID=55080 RepID=UPI00156AB26E|nr:MULTISPECIES: YdcF family protein [Brevibacillus]MBY0085563.1 YdcF family protein [Brevibacillus brevis]MCC8434868.1 YdcF family protein [Brevibacillus sp. M2.1A]
MKNRTINAQRPCWRRIWIVLGIVTLLGLLWSGYNWYRIEQMIKKANARHATVGIVLGAAVWGEGPSPGLRERLEQAATLYEEGYVSKLLVTGGLGEGKTITEAAVSKNYLVAKGIPEEDILLESKSTSTYENLLYGQQVLEEHHIQDALIISHDYHLARAMIMADSLGIVASPVGTTSHVLFGPYHKAREVLALTHWELSRIWTHVLGTVVLA